MIDESEKPESKSAEVQGANRAHSTDKESVNDVMPGRISACWVSGILVIAFGTLLIMVVIPRLQPLIIYYALVVLPAIAVSFALALRFALKGKDEIPLLGVFVGWLILLAGSAADISATLVHTPDLRYEANPLIEALVSSQFSLNLVFAYGAVTQILLVGIGMILWAAFLKHRTSLLRLMPPHGSLLQYLKAGTGARELSYRQWLCPLRWNELPWGYHYACWAGVCFIFLGMLRFYAAAEWYRLVLPTLTNRLIAVSTLFLLFATGYAAWLRYARRRLPEEIDMPDGMNAQAVHDPTPVANRE